MLRLKSITCLFFTLFLATVGSQANAADVLFSCWPEYLGMSDAEIAYVDTQHVAYLDARGIIYEQNGKKYFVGGIKIKLKNPGTKMEYVKQLETSLLGTEFSLEPVRNDNNYVYNGGRLNIPANETSQNEISMLSLLINDAYRYDVRSLSSYLEYRGVRYQTRCRLIDEASGDIKYQQDLGL